MSKENKSNEFTLTRIYDATVKQVWDAWSDPAKAAKWWGPRGFTITNHSKELKVGGIWHYTMHGPDGTDYPNKALYHEVELYKLLVYDHGGYDDRPPLFRVRVVFSDLGKKTKIEMTMAFPTPEEAEKTKKFIKEVGGTGTWDRLAEYLEGEISGKQLFVINRSFEASIEKVFDMWTKPVHFSKWMGPAGVRMEYLVSEIQEGKTLFYKMTNDKDINMYGKIHYHKIERPTCLEYSQVFCDEKGNVTRHPMAPVWPEVMQTKVLFASEEDGQTRVTVIWEPSAPVTPEELKVFVDARAGMTQGWTGSFDKLEEYLLSQ